LKLDCFFAFKFELQGIQNAYHRHIHAFSFKTAQKQKSMIFI